MRLNLVSMAACGVVGAATLCGMVLAAPYITPVQHSSAHSPNHPMFAALAQGARNALTFSGGGGAGGALHSGSSAPGAGAPRRGAPVLGAGDDDGSSTLAAAYSSNPHGSGVTLGSLERISDVASHGGFAGGGGYGGMGGGAGGGGFGGKGLPSPSLGSADQSMGNSGTDDVGDVDLNSLADAASAHPLKAVASVVPEPSTWAMMILGVGMLGTVFRRRSALAR